MSPEQVAVIQDLVERRARGEPMEGTVVSACEKLQVSRSTVFRYVKQLQETSRVSAIRTRKSSRKWGSRIDDRVETIIADSIQNIWLKRESPSIARLVQFIRMECKKRGLIAPGRNTIETRIAMLDAADIARRRHGAKYARAKFSPAKDHYTVHRPLEVVQIDHTPVDIIVVDPVLRRPIGRPWLTLAVDIRTRMIPGMYLSMNTPSSLTCAMAVTHCVFSKRQWLDGMGIDINWPVTGLPEAFHLDNAAEFKAKAFQNACREWGVNIIYRPPGRPEYGGHIERLIGTKMGAVHFLPGTTFSNTQVRADYNSERHAAMTIDELEKWLAHEIAGVYHHNVHSSLKKAPIDAWRDEEARVRWHAPKDREGFRISFLPFKPRKLQRDGIHLFGIRYWSDLFASAIGEGLKSLNVRYDPSDLSRVFVEWKDGAIAEARYRDLSHPPISLRERNAATDRIRHEGRKANEAAIFESIEAQRKIVEDAITKTKSVRCENRPKHRGAAKQDDAPEPDERVISIDDPSIPKYQTEIWDDQ